MTISVAASPVPNSVLGKEDVASAEEKSDSVRRRSSDSIGGGAVAPFQDAQLPASSAVHSPAPAPAPASEPEFFSHSAEALASAAAALASATTNEAADFTPAGKIRPRAPSEAQSDVSSEDLGAGTRTEGGGKSLTMPNNELRY